MPPAGRGGIALSSAIIKVTQNTHVAYKLARKEEVQMVKSWNLLSEARDNRRRRS